MPHPDMNERSLDRITDISSRLQMSISIPWHCFP